MEKIRKLKDPSACKFQIQIVRVRERKNRKTGEKEEFGLNLRKISEMKNPN